MVRTSIAANVLRLGCSAPKLEPLRRARTARGSRRAARARAAAVTALGVLGCTQLDPGSDRPEVEVDRLTAHDAAAAAVDPAWACLGASPAARAVPQRGTVVLSLAVADIGSQAPPAGLRARACNLLDVQCRTPITSDVGVSSDGQLHLAVPQRFDGFVELRSPDSLPTLFFLNRELVADAAEALSIVTPSSLEALAAAAGVAIDPERGHLLVRTFDCEGAAASGVQISSGGRGQPFTFQHGLPNVGSSVTTADGLAGFVNVPPGLVVLHGEEAASGRAIGETSVVVRPEWLTYGDVEPLAP